MDQSKERAEPARSLIFKRAARSRINERPGEVVCICEKSGNVSLFDPGAWWRKMTLLHRKAEEKGENEDDAD